ncbi:MAG: hybrid sensor histidine kinase/response regulator, partial [Bacteroidetes bacterium]|nr:hybrid sensor histidine kinase/response regulator [Bacteroidota bacterium]
MKVNLNIVCLGIVLFLFCSCNRKQKIVDLESNLNVLKEISLSKIPSESIESVQTETSNYIIQQLDNTKGLSNSSVNAIFQDSENLLWIGTWDGLNRYDGNIFTIFRPEADNKNGISNHVILKIEEDNTGALWVLTMHGINRYNKKTNKFQQFFFSRENIPPLTESEFNMTVDTANQVFCAVKDWGIGYFNDGEFQLLESGDLPKAAVKKMQFTLAGDLLILFENKILYSLHFADDGSGGKTISDYKLISENVRDFGTFSNSKTCVISVSGDVKILSSLNHKSQTLYEKDINSFVGYTSEGLVLSNKSEYFILDSLGARVNSSWLKYLENQKITTLIEGSENVIWTGTDGDGLFEMYPIQKSFNPVTKAQIPELNGGIVRTFYEIDEKSFLVGTKGKGLFQFSSKFYLNSQESLQYKNFNESNSKLNNSVFSLLKGQDNLVFIGTDGEGISVFDINTSTLINWPDIIGSNQCDYFKSVYTIYQDNNGYIWLGSNGYGMIRLKLERLGKKLKINEFKKYIANSRVQGSLSSNIIFSIVPYNNNKLWIGTRLGGLNLFDKETDLFKSYKRIKDDPKSLSNNDVLCLYADENNKLWIGTSFGLNLLESYKSDGEPIFKNYTVKDGLPNNTIHGIASDKQSNLWISTNFGLSNFIVNESRFINYTKSEGLQNNEFADGAFYQPDSSDYIFMGGIKGFNYFLPSEIKESTIVPNIFIEKISGQNKDEPYLQSLVISPNSKTSPFIELEYNQNFFDVELSALTFINSEKCQYAYQLENFNDDWTNIN